MRPPSPSLIDAVQATMNEEFANLMDVLTSALDFKAYFDRAHYKRYEALYKRYEKFTLKRERDRIAFAKLGAKAKTIDQQAEHASRLLAVVEKHTETMGKLSEAFRSLLQSQLRAR
jgi:hypothetical protein